MYDHSLIPLRISFSPTGIPTVVMDTDIAGHFGGKYFMCTLLAISVALHYCGLSIQGKSPYRYSVHALAPVESKIIFYDSQVASDFD